LHPHCTLLTWSLTRQPPRIRSSHTHSYIRQLLTTQLPTSRNLTHANDTTQHERTNRPTDRPDGTGGTGGGEFDRPFHSREYTNTRTWRLDGSLTLSPVMSQSLSSPPLPFPFTFSPPSASRALLPLPALAPSRPLRNRTCQLFLFPVHICFHFMRNCNKELDDPRPQHQRPFHLLGRIPSITPPLPHSLLRADMKLLQSTSNPKPVLRGNRSTPHPYLHLVVSNCEMYEMYIYYILVVVSVDRKKDEE
jgi:hypothetical protein